MQYGKNFCFYFALSKGWGRERERQRVRTLVCCVGEGLKKKSFGKGIYGKNINVCLMNIYLVICCMFMYIRNLSSCSPMNSSVNSLFLKVTIDVVSLKKMLINISFL